MPKYYFGTLLQIRDDFTEQTRSSVLSVHFDGKRMRDVTCGTTSNILCERLAVVVSGEGISKILGVPKLPDGTGKNQAEEVVALMNDWCVADQVVAMSFDTTASNTGFEFIHSVII
jgi:hypothetical protein